MALEESKKYKSIPYVEGVFTTTSRSRCFIKTQGRDDWDKICLGSARIKSDHDFMRKVKRNDRVRIIGISYNPELVGKVKFSECIAERAIILGKE